MKLYLLIPVYKGGQYWRECWQSVVGNLDFFEHVFVSVNFSEKQDEDISLIKNSDPEVRRKITWTRQTEFLTAAEHTKHISKWVKELLPGDGFLLNLCHDDILNRKGLAELSRLNLNGASAVFGSFRFFYDDGKRNEITYRLFRRSSGEPFSTDDFADILYRHQCAVSISGLLVPTQVFLKSIPRMDAMFYGWGAEHVRLLNPWIETVAQTREPLVFVREHSNSEGSLVSAHKFKVTCDAMLVSTLSFLSAKKSTTKMEAVRSIGYTLRRTHFLGIAAWIRVQFTLMQLGLFPVSLRVLPYLWIQIWGRIMMIFGRYLLK